MAGRPSKKPLVNVDQLKQCAAKNWSNKEIAVFFRVSTDTIERHFAAELKEGRESGKAKLRDLQWKRAMEGSDRMIIHMSEHQLGETPQSKTTLNSGESGFKIVIEDYTKK
jgi:hypothetical protein